VNVHWIILFPFLLAVACSDSTETAKKDASGVIETPTATDRPSLTLPASVRERIKTVTVKKGLLSQIVGAPGEVSLDLAKTAKVSSLIEGQAEEVFVQLGNAVKKGDPLVAIGSLKLDELVQEFLVSKVQMDLRKTNFERTQKLHAEQIVSERRLMEDRAQYLESKAVNQHVTEKLQNMGLEKRELNDLLHSHTMEGHHYIIKSPLSGTITAQTVVLGQGVNTGDHLFEVVDTRQVWIFANLPIEEAQRFKVGDRGTIIPKGRNPVSAPLAYIAPVADKATLTVQLRFDVDNSEGLLKPNEYVEVRLEQGAPSLLAIPITAPPLIEGVRGVFVKQNDNFRFIPVTLGQDNEGWVEVTDGVVEGDDVVIEGVFDLKNALLKDSIAGH